MPMDDDTELLERCPCCEYQLRGLPEQHRCPECGLPIDRRWRVLAGPSALVKPSITRIPIRFIVFPLLGIGFFEFVEWLLPFGRAWWHWPCLAAWVVLISAVSWLFLAKPRCFIAVGPDGVVIHRGKEKTEQYEWPEVGKAGYDVLRKCVVFSAGGRKVRLSDLKFFQSNPFVAEECAQAINAYPR